MTAEIHCRHCRSALNRGARVCAACGRGQRSAWRFAAIPVALFGGLVVWGVVVDAAGYVPDDVRRDADAAEAAIPQWAALQQRYGGGPERPPRWARAGTGTLAGQSTTCGYAKELEPGPGSPDPRAIGVGQQTISEDAIGTDPAVFEELWRRAGC